MPPKRAQVLAFEIDLEHFYSKYPSLKNLHLQSQYKLNAIDYQDEQKRHQEGILSCSLSQNTKRCFWDHHLFAGEPLFCPIKKYYQATLETYTSALNTKTYYIKDGIYARNAEILYEGYFCSFECCLAFIRENRHNPLYLLSEELLRARFEEQFPGKVLYPAPHWRLLREYGGELSIEEFRKNFGTIIYEADGILTNVVSFMFKKKYAL